MMLFSMLSEAQGGKSIAFLSRHFGLSSRQMTNVIRHFLPILMRGIQKNFAKQGGLTSLLKALDHGNYASYYEDPNIYSNPHVRNSGIIILEKALGSEEIQKQIMHRIYLSTGIDPDTLMLILPYVTTLALSALYIKAHTSLNPATSAVQLEYHQGSPAQTRQPQTAQPQPQYQPVHHQPQAHAPQMQPQYQQQPQQMQPTAIPRPVQQQPMPQMHRAQMQQPQAPVQQPQEKLPNIIRQAQAAHEQKERKSSKKGRLSQMLKAPFLVSSQPEPQSQKPQQPQQQPQVQQQQYAQQPQYNAPQPQPSYYQPPSPQHQHQQIAHAPTPVPQRGQVPSRKYVSLQEKLTSQLPWYEQTG